MVLIDQVSPRDEHIIYTYFTLNYIIASYFYLLLLINWIISLNRELIGDMDKKA